jgi:arabinan endo-1,5-alpha-L-arabinosidase
MKSKYILFALALTGALASCSDDDNNKKPVYSNPYSNPLTDYSVGDPTIWKENDHSFYVYATNTSVIRKSQDLMDRWRSDVRKETYIRYRIRCGCLGTGYRKGWR